MNKGIIFDVDGTILDSMKIWMDAGKIYLDKFGIEEKENIAEVLFDLTMAEGAKYIKETYKLDKTIQEIIDGINSVVYEFYENEAMPKDGVLEFIEYLYDNKIPMTVATSTDRPMIEAAFKRLGLEKYFKKIFTTTEVGKGKDNPLIFEKAMEEMKSDKAGTWLMDDAFYSLNTAYNNGINTVGIYDDSSKSQQEKVKSVSTIYIKDWTQVKQLIADMNL